MRFEHYEHITERHADTPEMTNLNGDLQTLAKRPVGPERLSRTIAHLPTGWRAISDNFATDFEDVTSIALPATGDIHTITLTIPTWPVVVYTTSAEMPQKYYVYALRLGMCLAPAGRRVRSASRMDARRRTEWAV